MTKTTDIAIDVHAVANEARALRGAVMAEALGTAVQLSVAAVKQALHIKSASHGHLSPSA